MYLDKPLRDHTLLQAIARVNRPYENEEHEMVKPHGFVLDYVGIFKRLTKALAFDSEEIDAIVKDIALLKSLFKTKMTKVVPPFLKLIQQNFNDKDVNKLIEHFRDPERRKELFKEYKEIEMLYEIISPDAFLRPYIEDYTTFSAIYSIVRKAYTKRTMVDREFQRKTNQLVREKVDTYAIEAPTELFEINEKTIQAIKDADDGDATRVINLIKSIQKHAEENSGDPVLILMSERAQAVQDSFENRQTSTQDALDSLLAEVERNEQRKREQAEKGLDGLTYFVYRTLLDFECPNAEDVSKQIGKAFTEFPLWNEYDDDLRKIRREVTFAIYAEEDDENKVASWVDQIFDLLRKLNEGKQ